MASKLFPVLSICAAIVCGVFFYPDPPAENRPDADVLPSPVAQTPVMPTEGTHRVAAAGH